MEEYFLGLIDGIQAKIDQEPEKTHARKRFALASARLGRKLHAADGPVAWCGVAAPFELLNAMGVTSCFVEFVGATLSSMGHVGGFLDEAESSGWTGDGCAYHRATVGAARKNLVPVPDFLVATSCPCSGGVATLENLARHFDKELFVLTVPQGRGEREIDYLAKQLEGLTEFVARHTGHALDRDRLADAVEKTNLTRELMIEIFSQTEAIPSPTHSRMLRDVGIVLPLLFGTEEGVAVAQAFRDELRQRRQEGKPGIEDERLRLLWIQNRIQFKNGLERFIQERFGAVIVADEFNAITWDAIDVEDPFTGMARRAVGMPLNGPIKRRVGHLQALAKRYAVHGAINPCHWGCRQGTGARGLLTEGLREIGVPVLALEVDCVDTRNFSEGQVSTRLAAFLEMLSHRV